MQSRILVYIKLIIWPFISFRGKAGTVEVCKSDRIRLDFGTKILISDWIGLEKLFRSRIESDRISSLDVDHFFSLSFFYLFLVLYLI